MGKCCTKQKIEGNELNLNTANGGTKNTNDEEENEFVIIPYNVNGEEEAPVLIITVIKSEMISKGTKIEIDSVGLINGSLRNEQDRITYFGFNDDLNSKIDEENSIDYLIPTNDKNMQKAIGRFFKISYNITKRGYYIKDLGNGMGTFIKIKDSLILKDKTLLNIGDSFIVIVLSVLDESTSYNNYSGIGKHLKANVFENLNKSKQREYSFSPIEGKVIRIGRKKHLNDIELDDELVSKMNSYIKYSEKEGWVIRDGKEEVYSNGDSKMHCSTNGTWFLAMNDYNIYDGMIFKYHCNLFECTLTNKK